MVSENNVICNFCFTNDRWTLIDVNTGNYGITPKIQYVHVFLYREYYFSPLSTIPQQFFFSIVENLSEAGKKLYLLAKKEGDQTWELSRGGKR